MSEPYLVRKGDYWHIVIPFRGDDGQPRKRWRATGETQKARAEVHLRDLLAEMGAGIRIDKDPTVSEWLKAWVAQVTSDSAERPLAPKTAADYRRIVERDVIPRIGHLRLRSLTPPDIQAMDADLMARGAAGKPLSRSSVRYCHAVLRAAIHEAQRQGFVLRNVAALARAPRLERKTAARKHLLPEEIAALVQANREDPWLSWALLALMTGLRLGEIGGLRWEDIDLEAGVLAVRRQRVRLPDAGGVTEREVKTAAAVRVLPLPRVAVDLLSGLRDIQTKESLGAGALPEHVFAHRRGGSWRAYGPERPIRAMKTMFKRAGLPVPAQPTHVFRHTHATLAASVGMREMDAQKRLGHAHPNTTRVIYMHAEAESQRPAVEAVAEIVLPTGKKGGRKRAR